MKLKLMTVLLFVMVVSLSFVEYSNAADPIPAIVNVDRIIQREDIAMVRMTEIDEVFSNKLFYLPAVVEKQQMAIILTAISLDKPLYIEFYEGDPARIYNASMYSVDAP